MKATWILPAMILLYVLVLGDLTLKYTNKKTKIVTKFEYNGLLWIYLDWRLKKEIPLPEILETPKVKFISITKYKQHEDSKSNTTDPAAGRL
jgi:hypothetical protein